MKSQSLYKLLTALALVAAACAAARAQGDAGDHRAHEILSQARAALGGEAKLYSVKALSVSWKFRRVSGKDDQDAGETQLDFLLPDKFFKREVLNLSGEFGQVTSVSLLSGERVWSELHSNSKDVPLADEGVGSPEKQEALRQGLNRELTLNLLQLMLTTPPSSPAQFTYAGEAEAEDGRADVLEAKTAGGLTVRLFFDKETHRLRLLSYREAPVKVTVAAGGAAKNAPQQAQYKSAAQSDVEVRLHFSDYRVEDGLLVPHLVTREKNGKVTQEAQLKAFKINPPFKAEHFEAKGKR